MISRLLAVALVAAAGLGCAAGIAIGRDGVAARWELFDVRVGYKSASAGEVTSKADKRPMSDNALEFGEKVAPIVAEAAARGAAEGALGSAGASLVCEIPELLGLEGKEEQPQADPENVTLSPEKIRELKERRRKRMALWADAQERERLEETARRIEMEAAWHDAIEREEARIRAERERSE